MPYHYGQIIDWQNISQGKDPYYYMWKPLRDKVKQAEVMKRREDAYIFNYTKF